jgi:hypothetical protein
MCSVIVAVVMSHVVIGAYVWSAFNEPAVAPSVGAAPPPPRSAVARQAVAAHTRSAKKEKD